MILEAAPGAGRRADSKPDESGGARLRIALAGGGTGGHVVPGLHLLARIALEGRLESVLWIGSGRRAEEAALERLGAVVPGVWVRKLRLALETPDDRAPSRVSLIARTVPAAGAAARAMREEGTQVCLGLGGYVCAPAAFAARRAGVPLALLEINAVRGLATRALRPMASRIFHAWPATCPHDRDSGGVHVWTGPPLPPDFESSESTAETEREARARLGFAADRPLLLIVGGSQGAAALNTFVRDHGDVLFGSGLQVLHQVGPGRMSEAHPAREGYIAAEYLHDVGQALRAATVVLGRGGASTLAEIAALRRPAVVVPYPHHRDRHQLRNAEQLGAGVRILPQSELGVDAARSLVALASASGARERESMREALARAVPNGGSMRILAELAQLAGARSRLA